MKLKISKHAYHRAKERLGWKRKAVARMASKALHSDHVFDQKSALTFTTENNRFRRFIGSVFFIFYQESIDCITLITVGDKLKENEEIIQSEKQKKIISSDRRKKHKSFK